MRRAPPPPRRIHAVPTRNSRPPAEGRLLKLFAENVGKVFTHRELVLLVQGYSTSQQEAPEIVNAMLLAWLAGAPVPEAADVAVERLEEPAGRSPT